MPDDLDLPIAQRRTRRAASRAQSTANSTMTRPISCLSATNTTTITTPARKPSRNPKRVRFSDPGPILHHENNITVSPDPSTGLTPLIRRTSLTRPAKRRRHSTPLPSRPPTSAPRSSLTDLSNPGPIPFSGEVNLLPLRQVLDGRVKRRIRRNGLSEEMNAITAEKRRRAREAREEIERLRGEVAEKDAEISRLREETVMGDLERVGELEREVEGLRRELAGRSGGGSGSGSPRYDWSLAARDPWADDFMAVDGVDDDVDEDEEIVDDGEFGDATMADLECSTPTRKGGSSFITPPTSSPAVGPETPRAPPGVLTPQSVHFGVQTDVPQLAHFGVQTDLADPSRQLLEDELASLQQEVGKLTKALESYSSLTSRLSEKLSPYASEEPSPAATTTPPNQATTTNDASTTSTNPPLESHLDNLLRTLSSRTAALLTVTNSLSHLGFRGTSAPEIITSISTALRTARLELEYLDPGESPLPLTTAGAAVLDLLLARLRDLSRRNKDADAAIDEYHALELSLRQQLGERVTAMDEIAGENARLKAEVAGGEERVAELEVGIDRLRGAVGRYERDVAELEALVKRLDGEKGAAEELAAGRGVEVVELQGKLADAVRRMEELQGEIEGLRVRHREALEEMEEGHREEMRGLNTEHGMALGKMEETHREEVRGLNTEHKKTLENMEETHKEEMRGLNAEHGKALETMEETHKEEVRGLNAEHGKALEKMQETHREEMRGLNAEHGKALAVRDARVAELRGEVERVNEALREAHEVVQGLRLEVQGLKAEGDSLRADGAKLRAEKDGLQKKVLEKEGRARGAILDMRRELERVVRMSEVLLDRQGEDAREDGDEVSLVTVPAPTKVVLGSETTCEPVTNTKSKKRRRYDSGLGLLDEEEVNIDEV